MKNKLFALWDNTDVKVFILCLLDEINHPMTYTAIVDTVVDTGCVGGFDFAECFSQLSEDGHIIGEALDGETYYLIADSGHAVARELRDTLPKSVREKLHVCAVRHLPLATLGVALNTRVKQEENGRYRVSFDINDGVRGELMGLSVSVPDKDTATKIQTHLEQIPPKDIYKTILTVLTGEFDYFS